MVESKRVVRVKFKRKIIGTNGGTSMGLVVEAPGVADCDGTAGNDPTSLIFLQQGEARGRHRGGKGAACHESGRQD
jgi:hypothetical protein